MWAAATTWWRSTSAAACCRCSPAPPREALHRRLTRTPFVRGDNRRRTSLAAVPRPSPPLQPETPMADDNNPVFQIQRIYLKDLSLEQPNSPQILLEQGQPQVEISLGLGAEPVGEGMYEVTVTATVT